MIDGWDQSRATLLLGAMSTVATRDGATELGPIERGLIDGAADHVFGIDVSADGLASVRPEALGEALTARAARALATQFLILVPYADMEVAETEVALVNSYAAALGHDPKTLTQLHRVRDGHIKRALLDYTRRAASEYDVDTPRVTKLLRIIHQYVGDNSVAERYRTLEEFPRGSLGHTFFHFYRDRAFPLPGEKKSLGETLTPHDSAHILGGFNTDGTGEINVAGFEAGMGVSEFGYELLLEVILDFHLGINFGVGLVGYVPKRGEMNPDEMMVGIRRGLDCNVDLIHRFDFWGVADEPVEALRDRYNIVGAGQVVLHPPERPATTDR